MVETTQQGAQHEDAKGYDTMEEACGFAKWSVGKKAHKEYV